MAVNQENRMSKQRKYTPNSVGPTHTDTHIHTHGRAIERIKYRGESSKRKRQRDSSKRTVRASRRLESRQVPTAGPLRQQLNRI